jgi:hypothetical protein
MHFHSILIKSIMLSLTGSFRKFSLTVNVRHCSTYKNYTDYPSDLANLLILINSLRLKEVEVREQGLTPSIDMQELMKNKLEILIHKYKFFHVNQALPCLTGVFDIITTLRDGKRDQGLEDDLYYRCTLFKHQKYDLQYSDLDVLYINSKTYCPQNVKESIFSDLLEAIEYARPLNSNNNLALLNLLKGAMRVQADIMFNNNINLEEYSRKLENFKPYLALRKGYKLNNQDLERLYKQDNLNLESLYKQTLFDYFERIFNS